MNSRKTLLFSMMSGLLVLSIPALGATASGVLNVSATISSDCTVGASTLAFGTLSSGAVLAGNIDIAGTVTVNCTNGAPYTVRLGVGAGTGATFASRKMTAGANLLNYSIYSTTGRTTVWGDGTAATVTVAGTGSGAVQSLSAYGRIFSGQTPQAGTYNDTVTVTVTY
jgi:spore coat protein U-like protein